jgi:VRR-NUC domain
VSLRIPLTVKRCSHPEHQSGRRVRFVVGKRCRPGEEVVLRRWRDRSREPSARLKGTSFEGCRLPPGTFQLLNACRAAGFDILPPFTADRLRPHYERARREHPTWNAPNVENTIAMLICLGKYLRQILERERSSANPGLPDLFLWTRTKNGRLSRGQFIEVKRKRGKYKERESPAQRGEREFLTKLGAKARVVYLLER